MYFDDFKAELKIPSCI